MTVLLLSHKGRKPRRPFRASLLDHVDVVEGSLDGASFSSTIFNLSTTAVTSFSDLFPDLAAILAGAALTDASIAMILHARSSSYVAVVADAFGSVERTLLQTYIVVNKLNPQQQS